MLPGRVGAAIGTTPALGCGKPANPSPVGTRGFTATPSNSGFMETAQYPASLEIDYPDRSLNRLTTFFRIFTVIPIAIVLGSLSGSDYTATYGRHTTTYAFGAAGLLFIPVLLMLLFRRKYPGWWFDWNLELTRFSTRVGAYVALLDDTYPSTDEEQSVHLQIERPDGEQLSRWLPLVKWLLAIPHFIIIGILSIAAFFVVVFAWFAILFTGRYPRGAFGFVVGVMRWTLRVTAYAILLTTDRYPPFSMD